MKFLIFLIATFLTMVGCGSSSGGGSGGSPSTTAAAAATTTVSTPSSMTTTTTTTTTTTNATTSAATTASIPIYHIPTKLNDKASLSLTGQDSSVQGLYFSSLEILAYNYRPSETVQNHPGFYSFDASANAGNDWSYWTILPNFEKSHNLILSANGEIDIDSFCKSGNGWDLCTQSPLTNDYILAAKSFSIDFLEVYFSTISVLENNASYGQINTGTDALAGYPEWKNAVCHEITPTFPNVVVGHVNITNFSILFTRDDWFPDPVTIVIDSNATYDANNRLLDPGYSISSSSIPLTDDQKTKINSLVKEGPGQHVYQVLYLVPTKQQVIDLSQAATAIQAVADAKAAQAAAEAKATSDAAAQAAADAAAHAATAVAQPGDQPNPTPTTVSPTDAAAQAAAAQVAAAKAAAAAAGGQHLRLTDTPTVITPVTISVAFDIAHVLDPSSDLANNVLVINGQNISKSPFGVNVNFTTSP